jgi:hypothetical protein
LRAFLMKCSDTATYSIATSSIGLALPGGTGLPGSQAQQPLGGAAIASGGLPLQRPRSEWAGDNQRLCPKPPKSQTSQAPPHVCHHFPPRRGKTTLTEKLLLPGAIQIAGSVKARKAARHATATGWKSQQRGISVSSVMQMEYRDCVINLLDTPGHQDFEDTYRVLTAVDALMVLTRPTASSRKPAACCRSAARADADPDFRQQDGPRVQDPMSVMDEIERELGMAVVPSPGWSAWANCSTASMTGARSVCGLQPRRGQARRR